ncbi:hypothetical protein BGZ99_003827 [Dissophora globulifera]|uniref:PH domain-containing protein n=1 Tax=Dissophora globulifera TaxID=979702 RepID=A0A9P6RX91_9FUNG|nr:hypothetical protein BGZ99_003827 [Dissophora globulifera]
MENKKKNSLSKTLSRTFGRKTAPQSPPPSTAGNAYLTDPDAAAKKKHVAIDTRLNTVAPAPIEEVPTSTTTTAVGNVPLHSSEAVLPLTSLSPDANVLSPESAGPSQLSSTVRFADQHTHTQQSNAILNGDSAHIYDDNFANGTANNIPDPISPYINAMHQREGTGMSGSSTTSHQGLSPVLDDNPSRPEGGLNPADILFHRLVAYHGIVKNLQQYFTEIALIENGIGKAMHKASTLIVVPFRDGHQFLGKGGLQDVCVGVRESSKVRSDQHASAARFIEETVIKNIRRLKQDIKNYMKSLRSDTTLYATRVFEERMITQERIGNLAKAIGLFEKVGGYQPDMERVQSDPYVINLTLRRQIARQVYEENSFARALKQCQDEIMTFEKRIINEIKQIMRIFSQHQIGHASAGFSQSWAPTEMALNVLQEDTEWNNFLSLNGNLLFPSDLVDADPEELDYPCKDSPYVQPLKTAQMSRQSTVLKNWKEGFFVLTMAGWLHVFSSADPIDDPVPERSIYLPTAVLGPHTDPGKKQHVFSLEGKGMGGLMHRSEQTFTVRANSREEMLGWWSELSKHANSTTFTQQGDGSLEKPLSRSGSRVGSANVSRSTSRATRPPQSPPMAAVATTAATQQAYQQQQPMYQQSLPQQYQPQQLQGTVPPHEGPLVAQDELQYLDVNPTVAGTSTAATTSTNPGYVGLKTEPRLMPLERHNTGSTVSLGEYGLPYQERNTAATTALPHATSTTTTTTNAH